MMFLLIVELRLLTRIAVFFRNVYDDTSGNWISQQWKTQSQLVTWDRYEANEHFIEDGTCN